MLVFYAGFGRWDGKKKGLTKTAYEHESAFFILDNEKDIRELLHMGSTKAGMLKPCYTHPEGARLDGFSESDKYVCFTPKHLKQVNGKERYLTGALLTTENIAKEVKPKKKPLIQQRRELILKKLIYDVGMEELKSFKRIEVWQKLTSLDGFLFTKRTKMDETIKGFFKKQSLITFR